MELTTNNSLSLPYECDSMFEVMRRVSNGKTGSLLPRPEYIPQEYYSRILAAKPVENHTAIFACLYLGSSNVTIEIRPAPTAANGAKLAAMLQSIVDSSKQKSTLLYAPGRLELPSLGVTASFNHGTWAIGQRTNPAVGQVDLLIRTGGVSELKIMPAIISGRCPDVLNGAMQAKIQSDSSKPVQLKAPSFVSPAWEQSAIELQPHDGAGQILITVCLQLSQSKVLDVTLFYGSEEVPQSDAPFLAEALDEIAAAVKDRH
jgi:hypothetical protein